MRLTESLDRGQWVVSSLAGLEVRSAIRRREQLGDLSTTSAAAALSPLNNALGLPVEQPLSGIVLEVAALMIDRHRLRTLDSLQLATALVARDAMQPPLLQFVACDLTLLRAAKAEGLAVWNPADAQ